MAYVLVAIGAVMTAAGLYTVAYSILNTRFEEYWAALGVGVTLTAGGTITIALGFAVRAIGRLTTALELRPVATHSAASAAALDVEPAAPGVEPAAPLFEPAPGLVEAEPAVEASPPAIPANRAPHPLRPAPPPVPDRSSSFAPPPAVTAESVEPTLSEPPAPDASTGQATPFAAASVGQGQAELPEFDPHPVPTPADDYKLETPSTPEHDLPERLPARPDAATHPVPPAAPDMPDDWLDRAFAELDEELPVQKPADPSPSPAPQPVPILEPEMAEPADVAAAPPPMPSLAPNSAVPIPPASQVIGRYEADGTSYVMYADGSIEAQSSSGVYRFSSMAELKSFIET